MSIIITGLEMPTERESFNLTIKYNGVVLNTETGIQVAEAHELPPHGRLIDADALEMERRAENAKKGWHDSFAVIFNGDPYYEATYDCTEQFKELVNNAPIIIEASE